MKALTLTQPWATLVAIGAKQIETRSWRASYRGPLAIHAAKGLGPIYSEANLMGRCRSEPFRSALLAAGFLRTLVLPRGAIVAVCNLVGIIKTSAFEESRTQYYDYPRGWTLTEQERAFGDYSPGRYAWLLADIRALPEPILAKGALGLWEWEGELQCNTGASPQPTETKRARSG
jgi:hypothetical protein